MKVLRKDEGMVREDNKPGTEVINEWGHQMTRDKNVKRMEKSYILHFKELKFPKEKKKKKIESSNRQQGGQWSLHQILR